MQLWKIIEKKYQEEFVWGISLWGISLPVLFFVNFFTYYFPFVYSKFLEHIFFATKNGSGDGGSGGGGDGGQRRWCYPCLLSVSTTLYIHSILKMTIAFIFNLLIYSNVYNF